MSTQKESDDLYMGTALLYGRLSRAIRAKVGAVLVTSQGIIIGGVNGTASGRSNNCEELKPQPFPNKPALFTKPEVIHAELNCILKAAREGVSCVGSTVYVTLSPCVPCSAMLVQAGIKRLIYEVQYRDPSGIELLESCGIEVSKY